MKTLKRTAPILLIVLLLALPISGRAHAQEGEPQLKLSLQRDFGFGGFSGDIQGLFTVSASGPDDLVQVTFYIDEEVLFVDEEAPFEYQFHTDNFEPGVHRLWATGKTSGGEQLLSNEVQREFLTGEDAWGMLKGIGLPLIIGIAALMLVGVLGSMLLGRKGVQRPIGEYGIAGGAICPKCKLPFSRHFLSPNLVAGKLERCPHCGKWSLVARAGPVALEEAEARLRQDYQQGQLEAEESEAERLRKMVEESKFEE